jgi:hypothetical protein
MVLTPWFKDVFAELNLAKKGRGNLPPPPPEMLFNLTEDRSIKTIHHRNESPPQEGTGGQPRKRSKTINLTGSDEESASSSSSSEGPLSAGAMSTGDDETSTSSAWAQGQQCFPIARGHYNQQRVSRFRRREQNICVIELVDKKGKTTREERYVNMAIMSHASVLRALTERADRIRNNRGKLANMDDLPTSWAIDETGTVDASLFHNTKENEEQRSATEQQGGG